MNLMTNYTEKYNKEHKGIELYFTKIPTKKEREELKENKFKYHGAKKCWYKYQPKEEKQEVKEEKINTNEIEKLNSSGLADNVL